MSINRRYPAEFNEHEHYRRVLQQQTTYYRWISDLVDRSFELAKSEGGKVMKNSEASFGDLHLFGS